MSTKSRQELFEEAKELRKKIREEETAKKRDNFQAEYEELMFSSFDYGETKIVRILGNPKLKRDGDPYSPKDVLVSWIVSDSDKKFRCVWPLQSENPNWILWKIYNKVMTFKWDRSLKGGKGDKVFLNIETHRSIFNRVAKNNDLENTYEKGWYPSKYVVINIIDRADLAWHKEFKHTKLLSKKSKEPGVPISFYNKIWDDVVEYYGPWENYDLALSKVKTGPLDSDVEYKAIHTSHTVEIPEKVRSLIIEGPLTDEEKSWEKYDLDKLFRVSSYQKIKRNLGIFIEHVDASFGTKFSEELNDLVEQEKKTFADIYKAKDVSENLKENSPKELPPKKEETKQLPSRTVRPLVFDISSLDKNVFKGLDKLSKDEKTKIIGLNYETNMLVYDSTAGTIMGCGYPECEYPSPETFKVCPKCGNNF